MLEGITTMRADVSARTEVVVDLDEVIDRQQIVDRVCVADTRSQDVSSVEGQVPW
jgi:hypothetical protein